MKDKNLDVAANRRLGCGIMQHYFVSAWIPRDGADQTSQVTCTRRSSDGNGYIGVRMPMLRRLHRVQSKDTLKATLMGWS